MKTMTATERQALVTISATAGQQLMRVVIYSCRAIRAETPEMLATSLEAASGAVQSLAELGVAILESVE